MTWPPRIESVVVLLHGRHVFSHRRQRAVRVDGGVTMEVEIAVSSHCLPKQAAVPEVDSAPEADTISGPAFLHHPGGKLV